MWLPPFLGCFRMPEELKIGALASAPEVGGIWAGRLPAPPPASSWKRAPWKYRWLFFSERWKKSVSVLPRRITGNELLGWVVLSSPVLGAFSSQQRNPPGVCLLAAGLPRGLGCPPLVIHKVLRATPVLAEVSMLI